MKKVARKSKVEPQDAVGVNPAALERMYRDVTFGYDEPGLVLVGTPYGMVTMTPGNIDGGSLRDHSRSDDRGRWTGLGQV